MSTGKVRVPYWHLHDITYELLVKSGLPADQAGTAADCFVEADMCGNSTHGVVVLPSHIDKLKKGSYNVNPGLAIVREGGAFAVIDADNAIGPVSAAHCMGYAMERCREAGIFTVFSRNSNTYGPAFYYTQLAAKENLIGITFCNSPAAMAPWGGKDKLLGTNPFSVAVPCAENSPVVLDMAMSKVAKSRINLARIAGEQIPSGWALDSEGNPTNDPLEAIKGLLLPMEGHKGYGLALAIDMLSGVLSGAAFLNGVGKFYSENGECMNVGQTFIAIDPVQVYGEEFFGVMDGYSNAVRESASIGSAPVSMPGDNKARNRMRSAESGIELELTTAEALNRCLVESGLSRMAINIG